MTPRRPRQRQNHHHAQPAPQIQASDYESDVNYNPPATRTNTELNLSVLRRHNPHIQSILSIAANAVIYYFTPPQSWEKSGIEGTLFVCQCEPAPITGSERFCLVVLNRRSLENIILDLGQTEDVELTSEYVILRFQQRGEDWQVEEKIMGVWMHADKDDTREVNSLMIKECWQRAKATAEPDPVVQSYSNERASPQVGNNADGVVPGRKLSIGELFGRQ
ncbi:hypothetical protein F5884DRAFT_182269 [Xylogone sp. PMI_703]|nr:hypothetical protein F5884DRAFT_182269 [Xylogone sp. PMI_703]